LTCPGSGCTFKSRLTKRLPTQGVEPGDQREALREKKLREKSLQREPLEID